jgi:hypothetical protein
MNEIKISETAPIGPFLPATVMRDLQISEGELERPHIQCERYEHGQALFNAQKPEIVCLCYSWERAA